MKTRLIQSLFAIASTCLVTLPSSYSYAQSEGNANNSGVRISDPKTLLAHAIADFENTPMEAFSYRVTRYENEEGTETSSIEVFSPHSSNPHHWRLVQKNNRPPTPQEQQAFVKRKQEQRNSTAIVLGELIILESVREIARDNNTIRFGFDVFLEKLGDEASSNLQGTLIYDLDERFIRHLAITNTARFSPMFAATIDKLKVNMTFTKKKEAVLPVSITMDMVGKFAVFSEINETSSDVYSDYQYVGSTMGSNGANAKSAK